MREALSPGWYSWMQPTYVGTKKSTAIHTSQSIWYVELPDEHAELLAWRPRHALEVPEDNSVPGSPTKAFRGPLTLHRVQRVGDCVHSVPDTVKPASTVAFSTIAVVFSQVVLLMKRAAKMLHSLRLLYRAAAGALNRQRCAVAPLSVGGEGCGGGMFAATKRARCDPITIAKFWRCLNRRTNFGCEHVTRRIRRPTRTFGDPETSKPNTEALFSRNTHFTTQNSVNHGFP